MILEVLLYLVCFSVFVVLQSLFINGVYDCLKGSKVVDEISGKVDYQGAVLYMIAPKFFEKYRHREWSRPLYSCIKCMASVYGAVTYWPLVIYVFKFQWIEILIFVFDVFILVYLNFFFFKKL